MKINTKKELKRILGSGAGSRAVYPDKQLGFPGTTSVPVSYSSL
jgi:hypothetical protein